MNRRRLALLLLASSAGMLSATCGSDAAPSASAESEPPPAELTAETQPGVEGNERPVITSLRFDPERPGPTGSVRAMVDVSDPDGDPVELAYTWIVNGRSVSGDGPELQRPVGRGDFVRVGVVASDGEDEAEPVELSEVEIANAAPWIDSEPGAPGPDGVFRYRVSADDIDHDTPLRFSLEQAPEGMTVNERSGLVRWSPGPEQSGRHRIEIAVRDSRGASGTQSFELIVGNAVARQGG